MVPQPPQSPGSQDSRESTSNLGGSNPNSQDSYGFERTTPQSAGQMQQAGGGGQPGKLILTLILGYVS